MKEYEFIGSQPVTLPTGQHLVPGSGRFRAELEPSDEAFYLKIHAIKACEPAPVVEPLKDARGLRRSPEE